MVLFKELKPYLEKKYPDLNTEDTVRLTGAVVNDLFGIKNMEPSLEAFAEENRHRIDDEAAAFIHNFNHFQIPLNDALRIQYLCDCHEGVNSEAVLKKARKINALIEEREVPMPGAFMSLVRSFGVAYKILEPVKPETSEKDSRPPEKHFDMHLRRDTL